MTLLAAYSCDAGSGTTLTDDSGNGHTGTLAGDVTWSASGHSGACISTPVPIGALPADGSLVQVPRSGLEPTTAITVMAWVQLGAADSGYRLYKTVLSKSIASSSDSYALYANGDTEFHPAFTVTTGAGNVWVQAATAVMSDLAWHHLAGTWDGTTAKLYVDGALAGSGSLAGTISYDTGQDLCLFGSTAYPNESMYGGLDDVRIYDTALTGPQVSSDMGSPVGGGVSALSVTATATSTSILTSGTTGLTATATGGSGTKTYAWTKTSGPAASFSSTTSATPTFTPTGGAGTYVLRCTVTDSSGSAYGEVTVTVSAPSSYVTFSTVDVATGWTPTGGTNVEVVTDTNGATFTTSSSNPAALEFTGTFGAISAPAGDLTVLVDIDKLNASSGSFDAKLYEGATLRSTVTGSSIPNGSGSSVTGQVAVTFPAADVAAVTSWASLTLKIYVTAA